MLSGATSALFIATKQVAAVGRHHKRGGAAFGCATSFVVPFVVAMNRVDVVAVDTILVLRFSKTGRTVGWSDSRLDGRSGGIGPDRLLANGCNLFNMLFMLLVDFVREL